MGGWIDTIGVTMPGNARMRILDGLGGSPEGVS
jgi:hypothetical protein